MTIKRPPDFPPFGPPEEPEPSRVNEGSDTVFSAEQAYVREIADQKEFDAFVRPHSPILHGYARALLRGDNDDPEDLVQEVLFSAWMHDVIAECNGDHERVEKYLLRSMHNAARNLHRKGRRKREGLARYLPWAVSRRSENAPQYRDVYSLEIARDLDRALKDVPERSREAFNLVHVQHKSYKKAAAIMSIDVSTVSALLRTANKYLRPSLAARGHGPDAGHEKKEDRP